MSRPFNPHDKVVCIDDTPSSRWEKLGVKLKAGTLYSVIKLTNIDGYDELMVQLVGQKYAFAASRFMTVAQYRNRYQAS